MIDALLATDLVLIAWHWFVLILCVVAALGIVTVIVNLFLLLILDIRERIQRRRESGWGRWN